MIAKPPKADRGEAPGIAGAKAGKADGLSAESGKAGIEGAKAGKPGETSPRARKAGGEGAPQAAGAKAQDLGAALGDAKRAEGVVGAPEPKMRAARGAKTTKADAPENAGAKAAESAGAERPAIDAARTSGPAAETAPQGGADAPAAGNAEGAVGAVPKPCPICGKPLVQRYRPFCSRRCADVDLNRWLSGSYAIPGRAEEDEDGAPPDEGR